MGKPWTYKVPTIAPQPGAPLGAALERTLWPAKIIDAELPIFLIPIRPAWSSQLFGVPTPLLPKPVLLGMSREHVYYRSHTPRVETAPARVLWYVTGKQGSPDRIGAVVACSRLEEVILDDPDNLYVRFRHLGVWHRDQIKQAARRRSLALALRFFDTEVLPYPVPLRRLRDLASPETAGLLDLSAVTILGICATIHPQNIPTLKARFLDESAAPDNSPADCPISSG